MAKSAPETTTDIALLGPTDLVAILTTPEKFDDLIGRIRKEVDEFVPDLTTKKGRDAIKSLAYKVVRTKTALDDTGKELNAGKRKEIDAVDAVRRDVRDKLDALAAEARKPLDEWENKEAERQDYIKTVMANIDTASNYPATATANEIRVGIEIMDAIEFDAEIFQEGLEIAVNAKIRALETLNAALTRAAQAEADAIELAALRQRENDRIEAKRLADEQAAQIEADRIAEENRQAEAKRIEDQRIADADAAEKRRLADIAEAEQRAAEAATAEAARVAQVEIDAATAETKRLQDAEDARVAEAARMAEEQAARDRDTAHKSAVLKTAKEAVMSQGGVTEDQARKIVLAIKAGMVPNVSLVF